MEEHTRRMTMDFRLKILYVEMNIVNLELPLNVPIDANLSVSSDATVALGRDFYAKVVFLAYKNCVLGDLTQDVFSLHIYANCPV